MRGIAMFETSIETIQVRYLKVTCLCTGWSLHPLLHREEALRLPG
jgi:hypothetical protein